MVRVAVVLVAVVTLPASALAWNISNRWTNTITDGGGLTQGDPTTLLWSVVPDGESWPRGGPSDLILFLDVGWGVGRERTPDLTNRPWWEIMERAYDQYNRVSGLNMVYVPEQNEDGADSGLWGDIRIGGVPFTWEESEGDVLADNTYPNGGDMRIDTWTSDGVAGSWYTDGLRFQNLIAHESGHGVGLGHDSGSGLSFIMEPSLNTNIRGLQFDDIYAFNRMYGDPLEKNGGNDSAATATDLGLLSSRDLVTLGEDADNFSVNEYDDQWLGLDGASDDDWFRLQTDIDALVDITVTPLGPTYTTDTQGTVDTSAMSNLWFEVYAGDESNQVALVSDADAGLAEVIYDVPIDAGVDLFIKVDGRSDANQFYRIDVAVAAAPIVLDGDFNGDGRVDAADYVVWRDNLDAPDESLINNSGDGSGVIDQGDYDLWAANYGASFDTAQAVPEPSSLITVLATVAWGARRSTGRR